MVVRVTILDSYLHNHFGNNNWQNTCDFTDEIITKANNNIKRNYRTLQEMWFIPVFNQYEVAIIK